MDYEAKIKELQQRREQLLINSNFQLGYIQGQLDLFVELQLQAKANLNPKDNPQ